jgi:hypothetical protein
MKKTVLTYEEMQAVVEPLVDSKLYVIDVQELEDNAGYTIQWLEHKTYVAYDGETYPDEVWLTEDNRLLLVQDIDPAHCRNILRMILRHDRESLTSEMSDISEHLSILKDALQGVDGVDDLPFTITPPPRTLH